MQEVAALYLIHTFVLFSFIGNNNYNVYIIHRWLLNKKQCTLTLITAKQIKESTRYFPHEL